MPAFRTATAFIVYGGQLQKELIAAFADQRADLFAGVLAAMGSEGIRQAAACAPLRSTSVPSMSSRTASYRGSLGVLRVWSILVDCIN